MVSSEPLKLPPDKGKPKRNASLQTAMATGKETSATSRAVPPTTTRGTYAKALQVEPLPVATPTMLDEWTEVTMVANTFKQLHKVVFPLTQYLLSLPEHGAHPYKTEWQTFLAKEKGLTADSTYHAVKSLMGLKNIDDYRKTVLKCPKITDYLAIQRSDPRYTSKIEFKLLKQIPTAQEQSHTITETTTTVGTISPRATVHSIRANEPASTDYGSAPAPTGQPKYPDTLAPEFIKISTDDNDKSFDNFMYQAFPIINSWCADTKNSESILSIKWHDAIAKGLSPLSDWNVASELLQTPDLRSFCDLVRESDIVQGTFDLVWRHPYMYYIPNWVSGHSPATSPMDVELTQLQDRIAESTTQLECFINVYTDRLQSISQEIREFSVTIKYHTQSAYDRVHEAASRAITEFRATVKEQLEPTVSTILKDIQEQVDDMTLQAQIRLTADAQKRLDDADAIYDDIFEQAVNNIYETAQEVIEHIKEHQKPEPAPQPAPPTMTMPATPFATSGDVRTHAQVKPTLPRTPWAPPLPNGNPVQTPQTMPKRMDTQTFIPRGNTIPHIVTPPTLPPLDHHKFIKYGEVTFTGNIFAFYHILQNFGYQWGLPLIPLKDIRHGKSLCPDYVPPVEYQRMTHALYEKLQSADCIPYTYSNLRSTLNRYSSNYDGYKALYAIMKDYVPRLNKDAEFPEPKREDFDNIHEYADQFNAYLTFEELSEPPRIYSKRDQIRKQGGQTGYYR